MQRLIQTAFLGMMILVSLTTACAPAPINTCKSLTPVEIDAFTRDRDIEPLFTQQNPCFTFILYEQNGNYGYCDVSRSPDHQDLEKFRYACPSWGKNGPRPGIGEVFPHGKDQMGILIYQKADAQRVSSVAIQMKDGPLITQDTFGQQGVLIQVSGEPHQWQSVLFFSGSGEEVGRLER